MPDGGLRVWMQVRGKRMKDKSPAKEDALFRGAFLLVHGAGGAPAQTLPALNGFYRSSMV